MHRLQKRAVLFDLDGTLINTAPLITESYRHAIRTVLGYVPADAAIDAQIGKTLRAGMEAFSPEKATLLMQVYREFNIANHPAFVRPFPGVTEALAQLRLKGVRLGIVTSKRRDVARLGLGITGLWGYFDVFVGEEDVVQHKPQPHPIWLACAHLNVRAYECIFVGDSIADMQAARRAGCLPMAVAWSQLTRDVLQKAGAALVLDRLEELPHMEDLLPYREPLYRGSEPALWSERGASGE